VKKHFAWTVKSLRLATTVIKAIVRNTIDLWTAHLASIVIAEVAKRRLRVTTVEGYVMMRTARAMKRERSSKLERPN